MTDYSHRPVMVEQVLLHLRLSAGDRVVDATVGCGGHAAAIMAAAPNIQLLGIDRDRDALREAERRLAGFADAVSLKQGKFGELPRFMHEAGMEQAEAILFDFGLSSLQIDRPERGFSFRQDGPLDMRMDQREPNTASTVLNQADERELTRIFREYGEELRARAIARAIVARRLERPWQRTGELARLLEQLAGPGRRRSGPPPPTRGFQALRIRVNQELEEIERGLTGAIGRLAAGGRIVAISFHSLEDRIVKRTFREAAQECLCPPGLPVCRCHHKASLKVLTKRPLRAAPEEKKDNPRAAPARLRAAEKIN